MSEGFTVSFPLQIRPSLIAASTIKNNDANRLRCSRANFAKKIDSPTVMWIETFRLEDETDYEYEIWFKVFFAYCQFFIVLFFSPEKLVLLSLLKEVKPSPDSKMIKLLTSDNLFPPLRPLVVDWRPLPRFPSKMTLPHARALLTIEKISYTQSFSSLQNL